MIKSDLCYNRMDQTTYKANHVLIQHHHKIRIITKGNTPHYIVFVFHLFSKKSFFKMRAHIMCRNMYKLISINEYRIVRVNG